MSIMDSREQPKVDKWTPQKIRSCKGTRFLPSLTAYDYPMARLLDAAGVPMLLVGDSLGMVVLGYPDTTHVTMEEMLHHVGAVARARPQGLIVGDLPYRTYLDPVEAVRNAQRMVESGADAVKMEGGLEIAPQIKAVREAGIECVGHLGMLPQHILEEGRYRIKGKTEIERARLVEDIDFLESSGMFAVVLELVQQDLSIELTRRVAIPTIGIGSGEGCDGQILVTHDLIGAFPWFCPRFVTPRAQVARTVEEAVVSWCQDGEVQWRAHGGGDENQP